MEQRDVAFDGGGRGFVRDTTVDVETDGRFTGATALDLPNSQIK